MGSVVIALMMKKKVPAVLCWERERAYLCIKKLYVYTPPTIVENNISFESFIPIGCLNNLRLILITAFSYRSGALDVLMIFFFSPFFSMCNLLHYETLLGFVHICKYLDTASKFFITDTLICTCIYCRHDIAKAHTALNHYFIFAY